MPACQMSEPLGRVNILEDLVNIYLFRPSILPDR